MTDCNSKLLSLLVGVGLSFTPSNSMSMEPDGCDRNFDLNKSMQSLQSLDFEKDNLLQDNSIPGNSGCGNSCCGNSSCSCK